MSEKKKGCRIPRKLTVRKEPCACSFYVCVILVIILASENFISGWTMTCLLRSPVASEEKKRKSPYRCVSGNGGERAGELLKDNGLIYESLLVFEVQYRLSGYYGGIKDGSYRAEHRADRR